MEIGTDKKQDVDISFDNIKVPVYGQEVKLETLSKALDMFADSFGLTKVVYGRKLSGWQIVGRLPLGTDQEKGLLNNMVRSLENIYDFRLVETGQTFHIKGNGELALYQLRQDILQSILHALRNSNDPRSARTGSLIGDSFMGSRAMIAEPMTKERKQIEKAGGDKAVLAGSNTDKYGGINFDAAQLNLQIKRDGRGVPLPIDQQDMAQLSHIQGLEPFILKIIPARDMPEISELMQTFLN